MVSDNPVRFGRTATQAAIDSENYSLQVLNGNGRIELALQFRISETELRVETTAHS
jgi:hypothetical protein